MRIGKLGIIGAGLCLFALGGFAGSQLLSLGGGKVQAAAAPAPPVFLDLEPLIVNLSPDPDGRYLQLSLNLRMPDAKAAEGLKQRMPELRHTLLTLLSSKRSADLSSLENKIRLGQDLKDAVNRNLGLHKENAVSGVMFSSFIVQ